MDDKEIYEFILDIKEKLSSISTKVDGIRDIVKNHEFRLQRLEQEDSPSSSYKDRMIEFMSKALIGLIGIVASLTGAGALLKQIFTN